MVYAALGDCPEVPPLIAAAVPGLELKVFGGADVPGQALLAMAKAVVEAQPAVVTVFFGTSDLFKKVAVTTFEMQLKLLAKALAPIASKVVMATLLDYSHAPVAPAIESFFGMDLSAFIRRSDEMNDRVRLISKRTGFKLADLGAQTRPELAKHKEWFLADGMHLSPEGAAHLAGLVVPVVSAVL